MNSKYLSVLPENYQSYLYLNFGSKYSGEENVFSLDIHCKSTDIHNFDNFGLLSF